MPFPACIIDKIRESRLRWYGHVQWRDGDHCVKTSSKQKCMDVGSRGRQRKRWINTISQDLITLNPTPVNADDWGEWRTHVAHHLPDNREAAFRSSVNHGQFCYSKAIPMYCDVSILITCFQDMLRSMSLQSWLQWSQQDKVKFQDQLFTKFQDNLRTFFDHKQLNTHSKCRVFSLTKIIYEDHYWIMQS